MRSPYNHGSRGLVLLVGLVALAACGSSEPAEDAVTPPSFAEAAPTTVGEAAPTPAPVETEPTDSTPVDTEPADSTPVDTEPADSAPVDTADAGPADPACLIGDWIVDDEQMAAYYDAVAEGTGLGVEISTTGNVTMSFTETEYVYDSTFTFGVVFGADEGDGAFEGTATGTWTGDDGVITTDLDASDITAGVTIAGAEIDGATLGGGVLQLDPLDNAPYSCNGPTVQLKTTAADTPRFPVELSPA